eukprot:911196-Amphidinium_carterae.1
MVYQKVRSESNIMQGKHRLPMPWEMPFKTMVRKGVPISALLPAVVDGGDVLGPLREVPPREACAPRESPAKRARVGLAAASSTMSRDRVLRIWATVCQQRLDTDVGAHVWGCWESETLSIVGDVMA